MSSERMGEWGRMDDKIRVKQDSQTGDFYATVDTLIFIKIIQAALLFV